MRDNQPYVALVCTTGDYHSGFQRSSIKMSSISNASCAWCHRTEAELGESLKRCAACQIVQYCSRNCQSQAWSNHKAACRQAQQQPSRPPEHSQRTITKRARADLQAQREGGSGSSERYTPETIYYLHVSTPHLHAISIQGPFYPLDAIITQVVANFGDEYPYGELIAEHDDARI